MCALQMFVLLLLLLVYQSAHRKHLLQRCMQPLHGMTHPGRGHVTMLFMYRETTSKSVRRKCWHRIDTLTFGVTLQKLYELLQYYSLISLKCHISQKPLNACYQLIGLLIVAIVTVNAGTSSPTPPRTLTSPDSSGRPRPAGSPTRSTSTPPLPTASENALGRQIPAI